MRHFFIPKCCFFIILCFFSFSVLAQDLISGLLSGGGALQGAGGMIGSLAVAVAVQNAVEKGQYAFVAVVMLMFGIQILKIWLPSIKNNAAQYSAVGGAGIGAAMSHFSGGNPVEGAVGGLVVGNAASGLYSSLGKPLGGFLRSSLGYLPLLFVLGVPLFITLAGVLKKSPEKKRKEMLGDFDEALTAVKSKYNPSTKALEEWISKNL